NISWKNARQRPLTTFLSVLLLAFGTGIISLLMSASKQIEDQFTRNIQGIDMVVGAKGSPLQLILSSVYQMDAPTGNIPMKEYQQLLRNRLVKQGIPLAYGDNYAGYRIVGTEPSYLDHYEAEFADGKIWSAPGEVVIGARVAQLTGLKINDTFNGSHGLQNDMDEHHHFTYKVVGILKPGGTVVDKLILTTVESVWAVHEEGHEEADEEDHHHEEHDHNESESPREITAALISFTSPMGNLTVPRLVNQQTSMQAALPAIEINRLFSLMGNGIETLRILAILIVLLSGISVFISLYQSLKDRKFELALLRSMGASRMQLFTLVIMEGLIISLIGYAVGIALGKLGLWSLSQLASKEYSYTLQIPILTIQEVYLLGGILAIGFLASLLPSVQAFRLNISKTLSDA
ncbi:MAG: ABC transporter permease, partial [Owenweeksia sp.]